MIRDVHRRDFNRHVENENMLDDAIEWIKDNLSPNEVFSKEELENWAYENDYVKETEPPSYD